MNQTQEKLAREAADRFLKETDEPVSDENHKILTGIISEAITKATSELEKTISAYRYAIEFYPNDNGYRAKKLLSGALDKETLLDQLRSDLESARKQIAEMREALVSIHEYWNGASGSAVDAAQEMKYRANEALSATGSKYVSVEHPVIVDMESALKSAQQKYRTTWAASVEEMVTLETPHDKALAAFEKLKGDGK